MAGHAYPHIVFATDADTLPRTALRGLLAELFADADPAPVIEEGALEVRFRLGDYTFTFWYDDEAEGLGERYAAYAPALRQRRIRRCTTMIDLSGEADPDGAFAEPAGRITGSLAARPGVFVFSEQTKAFVGLEEEAPAPSAAPAEVATAPAADVAEPVEAGPAAPEPAAEPALVHPVVVEPTVVEPVLVEPVLVEPVPVEPVPVEPATVEPAAEPGAREPVEAAAPGTAEAAATAEAAESTETAETVAPAAEGEPAADAPAAAEGEAAAPQPTPEPEPEPSAPTPEKPGLFKRLFGRGRG